MAVADVYDALISRRVYKDPMPHEKAVEIIKQGRGSHFDPEMVDAFLSIDALFHSIAGRYVDNEHAVPQMAARGLKRRPRFAIDGQRLNLST